VEKVLRAIERLLQQEPDAVKEVYGRGYADGAADKRRKVAWPRVRPRRRRRALGTRCEKLPLNRQRQPAPIVLGTPLPRCRVTVSLSLFFGRNRKVGIGGRERRQNSYLTAVDESQLKRGCPRAVWS
jgi:hypothetical protein